MATGTSITNLHATDTLCNESLSKPIADVASDFKATLVEVLPGFNPRNSAGVNANLAEWVDAKQRIYDVLKHHPNWNPDTLAVETVIVKRRVFNRAYIRESLNRLLSYIQDVDNSILDSFKQQLFLLKFLNAPNISKGTVLLYDHRVELGTLNEWLALQKPVVGQKTTRYIRSVLVKANHNPDVGETNRPFLNLCDLFSETEAEFKFILSINPCDYITMSNGNSWDSCHNLDGGCYRRGTLSYMNDSTSLISYVLPMDWEERNGIDSAHQHPTVISHALKYFRRVIMWGVNQHYVMQSRIYPGEDSDEFATEYTNTVIKIISDAYAAAGISCGDFQHPSNNSWRDYFCREEPAHYPDYMYAEYDLQTDPLEVSVKRNAPIGGTNYCLACGEEFDTGDSSGDIYCDSCDADRDYDGDDDDDHGGF